MSQECVCVPKASQLMQSKCRLAKRPYIDELNEQSKNDTLPSLVVPSKNEKLPGVLLKAEAPEHVSSLLLYC